MNKKKLIIVGISLLLIIIIVVLILSVANSNKQNTNNENINFEEEGGVSKLKKIKDKIISEKNYSFSVTLNDDNYKTTQKNKNYVKVTIMDEGKEYVYIVKDGSTYVLTNGDSKYTEYENNTSMLNVVEDNLQDALKRKYTVGKEAVDGKEYIYEEFKNTSGFLINYKGNVDNNNTKTRFYFENDDLKYIKTFVGRIEQLLKVDLEFNNQKDD